MSRLGVMWIGRIFLVLLLFFVVAVAGFAAWSLRPALPKIERPVASSFDPKLVARGAQLAAIGNCNSCHTETGGETFAGGRPMPTPFGTIYATNITPDPETGIGWWSEEAFRRAMHEGVDRSGRHLYPVFPYDHFTKVTNEDVKAIYAFLMTREPVRATTPANDLPFPLNVRPILAGWKAFFLDRGAYQPDPHRSAKWNRGAYLVEGLAHCGACHTPRNVLAAEKREENFAGGESENWHAPALTAASPAPVPWTADQIFTYLRTGFEEHHGAAAGPMAPVVQNLAKVPEDDVRAIAAYVASLAGAATPERERKAEELIAQTRQSGAQTVGQTADTREAPASAANAIYAGACAGCHDSGISSTSSGVALALSTSVAAPDPRNLIHFILQGVQPGEGEAGPFMPGFAGAFTDEQVVALVNYLRERFSDRPAWDDVANHLRSIRQAQPRS
jgi:mono/diheme cytochrome c family protein